MSMRVISHVALALLCCAVCAACAEKPGWDDVTADGPLLLSAGSSDEGMAAEVEGPLTSDEGCLGVGGYPAIWPESTAWDSQRRVLSLPDGVEVALGEQVSGGGGFFDQGGEPVDDYPTEVADLLRSCLSPSDEVALFNLGQPIEKRD